MSTQNGGPAFPGSGSSLARQQAQAHGFSYEEPTGMTLRDYFAAKAMQAILSDGSWHGHTCKTAAHVSYDMADAMLAARKNNKEK